MATTDLTRTPSSGGNRKTWTWSAWVKRAVKSDANNSRLLSAGGSNSDYTSWFMYAADGTDGALQLQNRISSSTTTLKTTRKFRDTSAWYHLVIACDTTQATDSNRIKIYVNGVQETSFSTEQYPAQDADTFVNHTVAHNIGSSDDAQYTPRYWAGSMSHVALVDGQQLTPTSFGELDSTSGIWKFKNPSGLSWGTNGFHLKFENSGNMGLDSSGQGNNYTVSGGTLTQSLDTPSNNHATLNPLNGVYYAGLGFLNGNTSITTTAGNYAPGLSTLGVNSGKWYAEFKMTSSSNWAMVGVTGQFATATNYSIGHGTTGYGYAGGSSASGQQSNDNNLSAYGNTYNNGDIIGIALDLDNHKLYFHKNGTYQNSGVPTSGSTGTGAISISTSPDTGFYHMGAGNYSGSQTPSWSANFGNGFFGTTAITSAGSNGNGSLFEYDCPSGYYALNTKNLNTYG